MKSCKSLFCENCWFAIERARKDQLKKEIESYDETKLLNTSVDDLCDYYEEEYKIEIPVLNKDLISAKRKEVKINESNNPMYGRSFNGKPVYANGFEVKLTIPFSGDHNCFFIKPSQSSSYLPNALVEPSAIILCFSRTESDGKHPENDIDREIGSIEEYLEWLRNDVEEFNLSLRETARGAINSRRERLLKQKNLVASLGFPLKEDTDSPKTYTAPTVRKRLKPIPPQASSAPYKPEPCLSDQDYEHILNVIQSMAHVMERSPKAFATMDEEALRTHFLVQLNGHYEGQASGETFNYEGKTDILVRVEDKNIFIGECKFWSGPKKLTETIDQLLGYSSWRDTKVAVLIFNRNKDLTKVLESAQEAITEHSNYKRTINSNSETMFRYIFSHRDDSNREMVLSVLVFDVPK